MPRARRAALAAIGPCAMDGHCTGKRPLSFGARPWCDVRAVAFNVQPAFAWHANKRRCASCLSGGSETRKLSTCACRAHALCRAGYVQNAHYRRVLHRREVSIFRRKTVVRRASCGLQRAPGIRVARKQAPLRWLSLGRWRNTRACSLQRARRAALVSVDLCTIKWHFTGGRPLSFGARSLYDVRAMASNAHPAFAWNASRRHCAGCLSGGGETRELAARARRGPLVVSCDRLAHCTEALRWRKASHPRCKTVVRRASFGLQQRTAGFRVTDAKAPLRWLSLGGGETRKLSACARRAALVMIGLRDMDGHCTSGRPLTFRARPWCDVQAVSSSAQPAFPRPTRERHCARCVSGGGEAR